MKCLEIYAIRKKVLKSRRNCIENIIITEKSFKIEAIVLSNYVENIIIMSIIITLQNTIVNTFAKY